jgi:hypothetical protein
MLTNNIQLLMLYLKLRHIKTPKKNSKRVLTEPNRFGLLAVFPLSGDILG